MKQIYNFQFGVYFKWECERIGNEERMRYAYSIEKEKVKESKC